MRAVIYARLSLDRKGDNLGVDRQIEAARQLCKSRDWTVVGIEQDNSISAYSGKRRPGWESALKYMADEQADVIVAYHLDRITRSLVELEGLIELGYPVATVSGDLDLTTSSGKMIARILGSVARAEIERKGDRQMLANQQAALAGKPWTAAPRRFGYTPSMEVVPDEAEAIKVAAEQWLAGVPMAHITNTWNEQGFQSWSSKLKGTTGWTRQGVLQVLVNPTYAGVRVYRGESHEGIWEPILARETHIALVAKRKAGKQDPGARIGRTPNHLLSGISTCGLCGSTVSATKTKGRKTYACHPLNHCRVDRAQADEYVEAALLTYLAHPNVVSALVAVSSDEAEEAQTEYDALRSRKNDLTVAFSLGDIDMDQLKTGTGFLQAQMERLEARIEASNDGPLLAGLSIGTDEIEEQWKALPLARQRALVARFLTIEQQSVNYRHNVPIDERLVVKERT